MGFADEMDWGDLDDKPLSVGEHLLKVARVEEKQSAVKKIWMYSLIIECVDGDEEGKTFFDNKMLEGKGAVITKRFLRALGLDVGGKIATEELDGCEFYGTIAHGPDNNGDMRAELKSFKPA